MYRPPLETRNDHTLPTFAARGITGAVRPSFTGKYTFGVVALYFLALFLAVGHVLRWLVRPFEVCWVDGLAGGLRTLNLIIYMWMVGPMCARLWVCCEVGGCHSPRTMPSVK